MTKTLMIRSAWTLSMLVALVSAHADSRNAQPSVYRINQSHSSVEFSINKWVVTRQVGRFKSFAGSVVIVPGQPESASVSVDVEARSIDTRNSGRDEVVKSDDFLYVERFPRFTFRSSSIRFQQPGLFDVEGSLTIRGVTRSVRVPVKFLGIRTVEGLGEIAAFESSFTVDRRDFGVLGSRWSGGQAILGNEVNVTLSIVATRVR